MIDYSEYEIRAYKCPYSGQLFDDLKKFEEHIFQEQKQQLVEENLNKDKILYQEYILERQNSIFCVEQFIQFFSDLYTSDEAVKKHASRLYQGGFGNIILPDPKLVYHRMHCYGDTKEIDLENRYSSYIVVPLLLYDFRFSFSNFISGSRDDLTKTFDCYIDLMADYGRWKYAFYVDITKWKFAQIEAAWIICKDKNQSEKELDIIKNLGFDPEFLIEASKNLTKEGFVSLFDPNKVSCIDIPFES